MNLNLGFPKSARIEGGTTGGATQFSGVTTPVVLGASDSQLSKQIVASASSKGVDMNVAKAASPTLSIANQFVPVQATLSSVRTTVASSPSVAVGGIKGATQFAAVSTPMALGSIDAQAAKKVVAVAASKPAVQRSVALALNQTLMSPFLRTIGR